MKEGRFSGFVFVFVSLFFFWNHNVIPLTISSLACEINNKGNLTSLSVQQWLTISTGSSPKLSVDTSVNASNKQGN